ncbi:hypothetical protein [Metabacillus sp. 84]|uniref:hypothetical protein n=1 Tax=Metabacillus sp. 84 TaxID=3404705 RepID=UPI003CFA269F
MLNPAWNKGYAAGAAAQRKSDIEHFAKLMQSLTSVKGIGEKTAEKITKEFVNRMDADG